MSKIDDLISPKIEVTFKGEKFTLDSGFTLEETPAITLAFGQKDPKIRADGLRMLLKVIVRRLYPDATEKQISKVGAEHTEDLLDVFYQIDGTSKEDKKDIKEALSKSS